MDRFGALAEVTPVGMVAVRQSLLGSGSQRPANGFSHPACPTATAKASQSPDECAAFHRPRGAHAAHHIRRGSPGVCLEQERIYSRTAKNDASPPLFRMSDSPSVAGRV